MVWVDKVLEVSGTHGECLVVLKKDALYMDGEDIRPAAFIEWVAQSFAYVRSAHFEQSGDVKRARVSEAFLVGIKDAEILFKKGEAEVRQAKSLRIVVDQFRELGPISMVRGQVFLESGRCLMRGNLRVYQKYRV